MTVGKEQAPNLPPDLVKDFRGHDADNCVFFLFGAVPNVCTVMRSGHVQQSDVNIIDRRTSAGQLAH